MKDPAVLTDEQFQVEMLELIGREFGVDGMARYTRLNLSGKDDYTRDRHQWLDDRTVNDVASEIKPTSKTRAA